MGDAQQIILINRFHSQFNFHVAYSFSLPRVCSQAAWYRILKVSGSRLQVEGFAEYPVSFMILVIHGGPDLTVPDEAIAVKHGCDDVSPDDVPVLVGTVRPPALAIGDDCLDGHQVRINILTGIEDLGFPPVTDQCGIGQDMVQFPGKSFSLSRNVL